MLLPLLLFLQAAVPVAPTAPAPVPRLERSARIDGVLDEPAWSEAARLTGFHQYTPVDSRDAEERTEVLVWYAPDAIYFGIIAHDDNPGAIRATHADRDKIDAEDNVTIYLDTFNDRRRAYFFTVNPLGVQQDGVRSEGGFTAGSLIGGTTDKNPDFIWESAGRLTDSGYVVELRIPFKSLRYGSTSEWGLNIARVIQRTGYTDTWTDTRRANASFLLQSGTITGLHDLKRGIVVEAQPFVTFSRNSFRDIDGSYDQGKVVTELGANLKLGLTSSTTVDATVNPDFSQVESDVGQVTVNQRFALYFPEKRPFFLEGIETFATPNRLVYTRQVQNPVWGGKVSSKTGPLAIGFLSSEDELVGPDAYFNILRARADVGSNSTAGIVATNRFGPGTTNTVFAADTRLVFGQLYYFGAQAGLSSTTSQGNGVTAPIWQLEVDRTGRSYGFNYQVNGIGKGFESDAGFVPRTDILQAHSFNRFSAYGRRGALLERVNVYNAIQGLWQHSAFSLGHPLEGSININASLQFRGGWQISPSVTPVTFVHYVPGTYDDYAISTGGGSTPYAAPRGVDNGYDVSLTIGTPVFQNFNGNILIDRARGPIFDEASTGDLTSITGAVDLRPLRSLRLEALFTYASLTRARDGSEFGRTIIPRLKVEYQITRPLFFRIVGEYRSQRTAELRSAVEGLPLLVAGVLATNSETNNLRLDALLSFQPSPGTVAFFGYGTGLDDTRPFSFSNFSRESDGFFVKFAYQFRR
ncbi:MAG: DUF5916 domain-containing protein [Gemmatimonadota bacterium]